MGWVSDSLQEKPIMRLSKTRVHYSQAPNVIIGLGHQKRLKKLRIYNHKITINQNMKHM